MARHHPSRAAPRIITYCIADSLGRKTASNAVLRQRKAVDSETVIGGFDDLDRGHFMAGSWAAWTMMVGSSAVRAAMCQHGNRVIEKLIPLLPLVNEATRTIG